MAWWPFKRRDTLADLSGLGPPLLNGRYQVGARIGQGGLGQVFEGVDMRDGQPVAVKFIPLAADLPAEQRREWQQRLHREARLSRKLRHPDILALLEVGLLPQHGWLVMERMNGADLGRYINPARRLPDAVVLRLAARIAAALSHAHAQGVLHRDLKPSNVMVDLATDALKLADFGLARPADGSTLTRTGMLLGTPAYLAPEVLAGAPFTRASDAYALGVTLYELLSGRRPHQAASLGELLRTIGRDPAEPLATHRPDLPAPVCELIQRLLQADPALRGGELAGWSLQAARLAAALARAQGLAAQAEPPQVRLDSSVASR